MSITVGMPLSGLSEASRAAAGPEPGTEGNGFAAELVRAGQVVGVEAATGASVAGTPGAERESTDPGDGDDDLFDDEPTHPARHLASDEALAALGWNPLWAPQPMDTPSFDLGLERLTSAEPAVEEATALPTRSSEGAREGARREREGAGGASEAPMPGSASDGTLPAVDPLTLHGRHPLGLEPVSALPGAPADLTLAAEAGLLPANGVIEVAREQGAGRTGETGARDLAVHAADSHAPPHPLDVDAHLASAPVDAVAGIDDEFSGAEVEVSSWEEINDESSDEDDDAEPASFREALLGQVADAAADLAYSPDGSSDGSAPPDGTAGAGGPGQQDDAALRHGSMGHNRAELVFGDGADRVALTVSVDGQGVQVHAQLGSGDAASQLLAATDELRRALERHGLQLSGFSASGESGAWNGNRRGGRESSERGTGRAGIGGRAVAVRTIDGTGRRGVRVIV